MLLFIFIAFVHVLHGQQVYGAFGDFSGPIPCPLEERYAAYYKLLGDDFSLLGEGLHVNWKMVSKLAYNSIPAHISLLSSLLVGIKFYAEEQGAAHFEKFLAKVLKERPVEFEALLPKAQVQTILSVNSRGELGGEPPESIWMALLYYSCYLKRPTVGSGDAGAYEAGVSQLATQFTSRWGVVLVPDILALVRAGKYKQLSKELTQALAYKPPQSTVPNTYILSHPLYADTKIGNSIKHKNVQLRLQDGRITVQAAMQCDIYALSFDAQFKEWKSKRWQLTANAPVTFKAGNGDILAVVTGSSLGEMLHRQVLPVLSIGMASGEVMILIDALVRDKKSQFVWLGTVKSQ